MHSLEALELLAPLDPDQLTKVTGGFDIGGLLSIGQEIASAVGGEDGKKAAAIMGKIAPVAGQLAGMFGGGVPGTGGSSAA